MYTLRVYTEMFSNGNVVSYQGITFQFSDDEELDAFVLSQLPKDGKFYCLGQLKKKGWKHFRVMDIAYISDTLIYSSEDEAEWEEGY